MLSKEKSQEIFYENSKNPNFHLSKACEICDSDDIRLLEIVKKSNNIFLSKCLSCGFIFLNPRMKHNVYNSGHVATEYLPRSKQTGLLDDSFQPILKVIYSRYRRIADLTKSLNPTKKVADIGCGIGFSMLALKYLGIESVGYDLNKEFINQANKFGLEAYCKDVMKIKEKYSIVTLSSMVEHLEYPTNFLKSIKKRVLNDNGFIVITVPNILSIDFILQGTKVPNINGNHFWYFSNKSLSKMLENAGFDIIHVHKENTQFSKFEYQNIQKYLTGFMGLDENLTGGVAMIAQAK